MAKRPAFFIRQGKVVSEMYSFEWHSGFAVSQKQKSIKSLHRAITAADENARPLEISTKSMSLIDKFYLSRNFTAETFWIWEERTIEHHKTV